MFMPYISLLCLALLAFDIGLAAEENATVPSLPVVATWGELGKLPPTILADGSEVRLGIQALEGPVGSAVAIYVLTSRETPPYDESSGEACGPVGVLVRGNTVYASPAAGLPTYGISHMLDLYAYLVPMRKPGPLDILIFGQQDTKMAKVTVTARDEHFQRWSASRPSPTLAAYLPAESNVPGVVSTVAWIGLGPGHAATPAAYGLVPWSSLNTTYVKAILSRTKDDLALPIAEPQAVHPLVHARATETGVTLTLPAQLLPGWIGSSTSRGILARWWKNGQPWNPSVEPPAKWAESFGGAMSTTNPDNQLEIQFMIDSEEWPKDPIEVQFLISSYGYSLLEFAQPESIGPVIVSTEKDAFDLPNPGTILFPRIAILPR